MNNLGQMTTGTCQKCCKCKSYLNDEHVCPDCQYEKDEKKMSFKLNAFAQVFLIIFTLCLALVLIIGLNFHFMNIAPYELAVFDCAAFAGAVTFFLWLSVV